MHSSARLLLQYSKEIGNSSSIESQNKLYQSVSLASVTDDMKGSNYYNGQTSDLPLYRCTAPSTSTSCHANIFCAVAQEIQPHGPCTMILRDQPFCTFIHDTSIDIFSTSLQKPHYTSLDPPFTQEAWLTYKGMHLLLRRLKFTEPGR